MKMCIKPYYYSTFNKSAEKGDVVIKQEEYPMTGGCSVSYYNVSKGCMQSMTKHTFEASMADLEEEE